MPVVECPACDARYNVDDLALGEGRKVRCGDCGNVWFQDPPEMPEPDAAQGDYPLTDEVFTPADDMTEDVFEPDIDMGDMPAGYESVLPDSINPAMNDDIDAIDIEDDKMKFNGTIAAVAIFLTLFLGSFGYALAFQDNVEAIWPESELYYSLIGMETKSPFEGLRVTDTYATYRKTSDNGEILYIEATIRNSNATPRELPDIRIDYRPYSNAAVEKSWSPEVERITLDPGESHVVKLGLTDFVREEGLLKLSFRLRRDS